MTINTNINTTATMTPLHIAIAILVTIIWGINFCFIQFALVDFPPIMLSSLRFFFTAFPLIFFVKRPKLNLALVTYGTGSFALQYGFLFFAMRMGASAGLSALVLQLQVFFTILLAYALLKENISKQQIIGMMVAFIGIGLIGLHTGGDMPVMGLILIICSAIGWSFGNIAATKLKTVPVFSLLAWSGLMAFISLTITSVILEPEAWQMATFTEASLSSWGALAFIVYASTFIGFGLWTWLMQRNPASQVAPFALLVPISGMISSAVLLNEQITWWKIVALVLILSGLVIANKAKKTKKVS